MSNVLYYILFLSTPPQLDFEEAPTLWLMNNSKRILLQQCCRWPVRKYYNSWCLWHVEVFKVWQNCKEKTTYWKPCRNSFGLQVWLQILWQDNGFIQFSVITYFSISQSLITNRILNCFNKCIHTFNKTFSIVSKASMTSWRNLFNTVVMHGNVCIVVEQLKQNKI